MSSDLTPPEVTNTDGVFALQGRQLSRFSTCVAVQEAPCIFCGVLCRHVADGGSAHIVGAMLDRGPEWFYYHDSPSCDGYVRAQKALGLIVWRCGCDVDYVENIGPFCHSCGASREACQEYPSIVLCPRCHDDEVMASEAQPVLRLRCLSCGIVARHVGGALQIESPSQS